MKEILDFILDNWETGLGISTLLVTLILRLIPTEKNHDLILKIFKILDAVIPNVRKGGGKHTITKMVVIFMLFGFSANAQIWQNYKGIRLVNEAQPITNLLPISASITYAYDSVGGVRDLWAYDTAWFKLRQSGGGGGIGFANNGLSLSGDTVQLGGTLTKQTVIGDFSANYFALDFTVTPFSDLLIGQTGNESGSHSELYFEPTFSQMLTKRRENISSPLHEYAIIMDASESVSQLSLETGGGNISLKTGLNSVTTTERLKIDSVGNINMDNSRNVSIGSVDPVGGAAVSSSYYNQYPTNMQLYADRSAGNASTNFTLYPLGVSGIEASAIGSNITLKTDTYANAGVERLKIDSVGNISMNNTETINISFNSGSFSSIYMQDGASYFQTAMGNDNGSSFIQTENNYARFSTGFTHGASEIKIDSSGNLALRTRGINTTPLSDRLKIDSVGQINLTSPSASILLDDNTSNPIVFQNVTNQYQFTSDFDPSSTPNLQAQGTGDVNIQLSSRDGGDVLLNAAETRTARDLTLGFTGTSISDLRVITTDGSDTDVDLAIGTKGDGDIFITGHNTQVISSGADLELTAFSGGSVNITGNQATFGIELETGTSTATLKINDGPGEQMGVATLVGGTVTINNTKITANSRIFLTVQSLGTVAIPTAVAVTARSAGTSFTITSAAGTDTSVIAWLIVEPN